MNKYSIIQYLLNATENNYLEGILFEKIEPSKIVITATVSTPQKIQPVLWMIEANMYTRKDLLAMSVNYLDDGLEIHSFENITYIINVKCNNKNKR